MKHIVITLLTLSIAATVYAGETNVTGKSYSFTIPDTVTFESHKEMEVYTFRWGTPPFLALFLLNAHPAPVTPGTLKPMADMMEVMFVDQMKEQVDVSDIQKKRREIAYGSFKGTELEFIITHPAGTILRQYMFILHDGHRAWNGQLTASSTNDLARAHTIMEKAKRIPKKPITSNKK